MRLRLRLVCSLISVSRNRNDGVTLPFVAVDCLTFPATVILFSLTRSLSISPPAILFFYSSRPFLPCSAPLFRPSYVWDRTGYSLHSCGFADREVLPPTRHIALLFPIPFSTNWIRVYTVICLVVVLRKLRIYFFSCHPSYSLARFHLLIIHTYFFAITLCTSSTIALYFF